MRLPKRSPQNWFSTSIVTVAPASTACWKVLSTSSTYTNTPTVVPPSSVGDFTDDQSNESDTITTESPI